MRAIVQDGYGSIDVLELRDVERPKVAEDQVQVKVAATALHAGDYYCMKGEPFAVRLAIGVPKPKGYIPGYDVAGTVEAVGSNVTRIQPGDVVFGGCSGSCAEYVSASESTLVTAPTNLALEEVAAVPTSGLAALHGLRDAAKVRAGQSVLVNGASGGVGTYAVQIAKAMGAEVTGVCSTRNVELVRSIGADHVIDYTKDDFTKGDKRYDVILDNVANHSLKECRRALKPDGLHIPNSGNAGMGYVIKAFASSILVGQQGKPYLSTPNTEDLDYLKELIQAGQLKPVVDRRYPLEKTMEAMSYLGKGHVAGKIVILVDDGADAQSSAEEVQ